MRNQKNPAASLSEVQRRAFKALFIANHLIAEAADAALAEAGVGTMLEYDVLYTLLQAPEGALTMREIAASVALSSSGLSRLVDRLEGRGYVARCAFEGDGRAVAVRLEEDGRRRIDEVWAVLSATAEERFARALTDEEHAELLRLMRKVLEPLVADKEARTGLSYLQKV